MVCYNPKVTAIKLNQIKLYNKMQNWTKLFSINSNKMVMSVTLTFKRYRCTPLPNDSISNPNALFATTFFIGCQVLSQVRYSEAESSTLHIVFCTGSSINTAWVGVMYVSMDVLVSQLNRNPQPIGSTKKIDEKSGFRRVLKQILTRILGSYAAMVSQSIPTVGRNEIHSFKHPKKTLRLPIGEHNWGKQHANYQAVKDWNNLIAIEIIIIIIKVIIIITIIIMGSS